MPGCGVAGGRFYQGQERDPHGSGLWRAQTQFRGAAFLGPGILRQHGRARRGSHPRLHPQSREGRSEAGADEPLALTRRLGRLQIQGAASATPSAASSGSNPKAPGSYGVGFVKPFFQHLVVSPRWKEGAEGWTCWSSLSEREAKRGYDPIQGWSHSYRPNWPASSYPAEREALNHHALVRQGRGPRRQVQIFATALKPEPGAAHCHLGAVRKRRWVASSSSRLFWRFVHHCGRSRRGSSFSAP